MRLLKNIIKRKTVFIFLFSLYSLPSFSQGKEFVQIGEFGAGVGTTQYMGDANPRFNFRFHSPAINLFYRHNLKNEEWVLKSQILFGSLFADESKLNDPILANRGLKFSAQMAEASFTLEYNFFDFRNLRDLKIHRIHCPYLSTGIAFANLFSDQSVTNNQQSFYASFILGVGMRLKVGKKLNLGGEITARHTFSDKIDGIDSSTLIFGSSKHDIYFNPNITIGYSIYKDTCPGDTRKSAYKN